MKSQVLEKRLMVNGEPCRISFPYTETYKPWTLSSTLRTVYRSRQPVLLPIVFLYIYLNLVAGLGVEPRQALPVPRL